MTDDHRVLIETPRLNGNTLRLSISSAKPPSTSIDGKAVAVLLKPLIDLHGKPRNWSTAAPLYIDALSDIPPHLLRLAVKQAIASNPYFPKPAELRASITEELSLYRREREEARLAALPKLPEPPPPSPEDIAHVTEVMNRFRAAVRQRSTVMQGGTAE